MYKSGQIVFDTNIDEPVVFIEGDGEDFNVVCTGVDFKTASSPSKNIIPIWGKNDKVFVGKMAKKSFNSIHEIDEDNCILFQEYIYEISKEVSGDGKKKEYKYYIRKR